MLGELALINTASLIEQHRVLLDTAREQGLDAAYQPFLLTETLNTWMRAPDWDTSQQYLHDHPEILGEDISDILEDLGTSPNPQIAVHQALLTIARGPGGVQGAYECLVNEQALKLIANEAVAARDVAQIDACAAIEAFVYRHALTYWLYMSLTRLLTHAAASLADGFTSQLHDLAAQADVSEQESVLAELETAITKFPIDARAADQLRRALGVSGNT